jgi:acetyl esterase/lipase
VLAIHGGSWIGGSKSEYGPQVERLARHGYVVFVADYRLARPGLPSWPEVLDDLRESVRWIRLHADEYHVDPERIVAMGSSAGGHLAALLGTLPPTAEPNGVSCRVQAVVNLYGPSDLVELMAGRKLSNDPVRLLIGATLDEGLPRLRQASPMTHVTSDDAPMLLIHGSDDRWIPIEQSQRMAESLARAGVRHRLLAVPGARHGFELMVEFPEKRDLLPEILAFLENVWQVHSQNRPDSLEVEKLDPPVRRTAEGSHGLQSTRASVRSSCGD